MVTATLPADPNVLPIGHYMVFAMVDDIPSIGRIVQVTDDPPVPGDVNGDGLANTGDVTVFVNLLFDAATATVCQFNVADGNNDGDLNGLDVQPFVTAILEAP